LGRLKPPTKQQISNIINSLTTPEAKLAAELGAFSGLRLSKIGAKAGVDILSPDGVTPFMVCANTYDTMRFSYLSTQGCERVRAMLSEPTRREPPYDVWHVTFSRQPLSEVRAYLKERGLGADALRRYFVHSLAEGQMSGKTNLTDDELCFLLGYGMDGISERNTASLKANTSPRLLKRQSGNRFRRGCLRDYTTS
jgi:hypothetical protein